MLENGVLSRKKTFSRNHPKIIPVAKNIRFHHGIAPEQHVHQCERVGAHKGGGIILHHEKQPLPSVGLLQKSILQSTERPAGFRVQNTNWLWSTLAALC